MAPVRTTRAPGVVALAMTVGEVRVHLELLGALGFAVEERRVLDGPGFDAFAGAAGASAELARLRLGDEQVVLIAYRSPMGAVIDADAVSNDLAFQHFAVVVRDVDRVLAELASGARVVGRGPQTIPRTNPAAGGIRAVYLRGPEGHPVELLAFPHDKGDARWHRSSDDRFLGIDHTAIVVADEARSRAFYEELGFRAVAHSLNEGEEQEALTGVAGARVKIRSLRGAAGPGIELLEYLSPGARPSTSRTSAGDHVRSEIWIDVPDLSAVAARAAATIVDIRALGIGYARCCRFDDPDGHGLRLLERDAR